MWQNDQRNGEGGIKFSNDARYAGTWKNGIADGTGTYTASDGRPLTGTWKHGCLRVGDHVVATVGVPREACR
jgi:hypothetical protein